MIFTGVGSRETPPIAMELLTAYARICAKAGMTGRSGAAAGADTAIETGIDLARGKKEIYLPWRGFNSSTSSFFGVTDQALAMAAKVHPAWDRLSDAAKKLHGRNVYQVLGANLSAPSNFLICWTADGIETEAERTRKSGGTATAIVLACRHGVPVFNIAKSGTIKKLNDFLQKNGVTDTFPSVTTEKVQAPLF